MKTNVNVLLLGLLLVGSTGRAAYGADYRWIGGAEKNKTAWSNPANWETRVQSFGTMVWQTAWDYPGHVPFNDSVNFNGWESGDAVIDVSVNLLSLYLGASEGPYLGKITLGAGQQLRVGSGKYGGVALFSGTLDCSSGNLIVTFLGVSGDGTFLAPGTGHTFKARGIALRGGTYKHDNGTVFIGKLDRNDTALTDGALMNDGNAFVDLFNLTIDADPASPFDMKGVNIHGTLRVTNVGYFHQPRDYSGYVFKAWGNVIMTALDTLPDDKIGWLATLELTGQENGVNNLQVISASGPSEGTFPCNIRIKKDHSASQYVLFNVGLFHLYGQLDIQSGNVIFNPGSTLEFRPVTYGTKEDVFRSYSPTTTILGGVTFNCKAAAEHCPPIYLGSDLYVRSNFVIANADTISSRSSTDTYTVHLLTLAMDHAVSLLDGAVDSGGGGWKPVNFVLEGAKEAHINGPGQIPNLTINKSSFVAMPQGGDQGSISVLHDLTLSKASYLQGGVISVNGDIKTTWRVSPELMTPNTTLIKISGAANQKLYVPTAGGQGAVPHVSIEKSGGTLTVSDEVTERINVYGSWSWVKGSVDYRLAKLNFMYNNEDSAADFGQTGEAQQTLNSVTVETANGNGNSMAFSGSGFTTTNFTVAKGSTVYFAGTGFTTTTFTISAGSTVHFAGGLTYKATRFAWRGDVDHPIVLRTDYSGIPWKLNRVAGGSLVVDFVDVQYSDASPGVKIRATNSIDGGHNTNWVFQ